MELLIKGIYNIRKTPRGFILSLSDESKKNILTYNTDDDEFTTSARGEVIRHPEASHDQASAAVRLFVNGQRRHLQGPRWRITPDECLIIEYHPGGLYEYFVAHVDNIGAYLTAPDKLRGISKKGKIFMSNAGAVDYIKARTRGAQ